MKQLIKQLKKNWIRVWLIVIMIICTLFVAYAAYTEVYSVKRVVSTTTSPGDPFSSNCMRTDELSYRLTAEEFHVTVCNYDQNYPNDYCTSPIAYEFEAELKFKTDSGYINVGDYLSSINDQAHQEEHDYYVNKIAKYSVFKTEDDSTGSITSPIVKSFDSDKGYKVTFDSDSLATGRSNTDVYTVKIDPADLNDPDETPLFVFVKAHPTAGGTLSDLKARLFATKGKEADASWSGRIQEANPAEIDYDFYNYVITGSGVGSIDILWDPTKLEVNKFFLIEENKTPDIISASDTTVTNDNSTYGVSYQNWKRITIAVDSTDKSRYELQLYKVSENQHMSSPKSYIACEFTKTGS